MSALWWTGNLFFLLPCVSLDWLLLGFVTQMRISCYGKWMKLNKRKGPGLHTSWKSADCAISKWNCLSTKQYTKTRTECKHAEVIHKWIYHFIIVIFQLKKNSVFPLMSNLLLYGHGVWQHKEKYYILMYAEKTIR